MTTIIYERHEAREAAEHWVKSLGLEDGASLDFTTYHGPLEAYSGDRIVASLPLHAQESVTIHATEWTLEELDGVISSRYPDLIAFTTEGGYLQIRRIWSKNDYRWYVPPNEITSGYHMTLTLSMPLNEWEKVAKEA